MAQKTLIYGNYKVLGPDDNILFRCGLKKFTWYLKKNLAERIDSHTIKINFIPKGNGHVADPYYVQPRDNLCSVCGTEYNLSKHHVVPYCYRRYFPEIIKNHSYHDVLPLCMECHNTYEKEHSIILRKILAEKYDVPVHGFSFKEGKAKSKAVKSAKALSKYSGCIPEFRKKELRENIRLFLECEDLTDSDIVELAKTKWRHTINRQTHGEAVMSKVEDLQDFVITWRKHFIETMKPQHLPRGWDIHRNIYR